MDSSQTKWIRIPQSTVLVFFRKSPSNSNAQLRFTDLGYGWWISLHQLIVNSYLENYVKNDSKVMFRLKVRILWCTLDVTKGSREERSSSHVMFLSFLTMAFWLSISYECWVHSYFSGLYPIMGLTRHIS